jgi:hypothetical protein
MATTSTGPGCAGKCYFTTLPGELRNHTYDFVAEKQAITYLPHRPKTWNIENIHGHGIVQEQPKYLALIQVCRLFRAGLLPIYALHTKVHVSHIDLEQYMINDLKRQVTGEMYVDFKSMGFHERDQPIVNVLPSLECCMDLPNLQVRTGFHDSARDAPDWIHPKSSMNTLLGVA